MLTKTSKLFKTFLFISAALFIVTSTAYAQLYGESVALSDLTDSRTMTGAPGEIDGNWTGFTISWDIAETSPGSGLWDYSYSLNNSRDVSNFILEITEEGSFDTFIDVIIEGSSAIPGTNFHGPQTWTMDGSFTLPDPIYGYKFENGTNPLTVSFTTDRDPVWGNFYAKDGMFAGDPVYAVNAGLTNLTSSDTNDFIVRPNGGANPPVVPEPISSVLFLVGGATLGLRRFRKKLKK